MLSQCRVLIAEDESLIAMDLAHAVEAAHGAVAGPFATVRDGLVYLAHSDVHAGILDVHLADRDVAPLALALLEKGKVVVFHTASDVPAAVTDRHGEQQVCRKPMAPEHVVMHLAKSLAASSKPPARVDQLDAFDHPLKVDVVEGEIVVTSDQAGVAMALTPGSARSTGRRLISQADEAERERSADRRSRARPAGKRSPGA